MVRREDDFAVANNNNNEDNDNDNDLVCEAEAVTDSFCVNHL